MSKKIIKAALIQMCSSVKAQQNIAIVEKYIRAATADGAQIIFTPEMTPLLNKAPKAIENYVNTPEKVEHLHIFAGLAQTLGIYISLGSCPDRNDKGQLVNRSYFFSPYGKNPYFYDKIHMFDVTLPDGQVFQESARYTPGEKAIVLKTPLGNLGLSICYDLRFPQLYHDLASAGAEVLLVPSAFTAQTGKAHWEPLLRARAIENGAYVIAAAQSGTHEDGRVTYGHSMVINPWGEIIINMEQNTGYRLFDYDIAKVEEARTRIPSLQNTRKYKQIIHDIKTQNDRA